MDSFDRAQLLKGMASGLLAALIWGSWPIVSRLAVNGSLNAFDLTALRFGISGLILLPYLWHKGLRGVPKKAILLMVAGAGAPYVLLGVWAISIAPAGHFGIVTPSCMLCFSSIGGWLVLKEPLGRDRLIGLGLILIGISMVGWHSFVGPSHDSAWFGHGLFLVCGFMWATYNVASRAFKVEPLHGTALISVFSMILYLPFYCVFGLKNLLAAPLGEVVFHGFFQGVITAIVALFTFTRATVLLGAGRGATFAALAPGFALLLAWPVLGERPQNLEILGLIVVTSGMLWALGGTTLLRKKRRPIVLQPQEAL